MRSRVVLPTCLLALLCLFADAAKKKGVTMVVRMLDGHACNLGNNALTWSKVWFTPRGMSRLGNADFGLSRTAKTISKLEFKLSKCADAIISINTCEYVETFNYAVGTCAIMKMPNAPWTQFFASMKPPFFCPIKAAETRKNMKMDNKPSLQLVWLHRGHLHVLPSFGLYRLNFSVTMYAHRHGNYSFRNAGLDPKTLEQYQYVPFRTIDNVIWITTLRMFDQDAREFICFNYTIEFMRTRQ